MELSVIKRGIEPIFNFSWGHSRHPHQWKGTLSTNEESLVCALRLYQHIRCYDQVWTWMFQVQSRFIDRPRPFARDSVIVLSWDKYQRPIFIFSYFLWYLKLFHLNFLSTLQPTPFNSAWHIFSQLSLLTSLHCQNQYDPQSPTSTLFQSNYHHY